MLAKTLSVALVGADAHLVEVEVHTTQGVPNFTVVGLPAKSVREAEQRTRSALLSSDQRWPPCRTVANLAPASLRKEGTHFDLAIAAGILAADKRLDPATLEGWVFLGELSLNGSVRGIRGTLPAAIVAGRTGASGIICPAANAAEAAVIDGLRVVPVATLRECIDFLRGRWEPPQIDRGHTGPALVVDDMEEVRGQDGARKAAEVAAAGGHNLLLSGPPGSGKTMIARRLPGILPRMTPDEAIEVTRIHSVAGLVGEGQGLVAERPFRAPHHGVSVAGLVGGGTGLARPGEVVLANHGVLFMDEMPLFRRDALEALRAPLEDGIVRISRRAGTVSFPCRFSLVAAMNPCPCGYSGDRARPCKCSGQALRGYEERVSGPLIDRFDLQVEMSRMTAAELLKASGGEPSSEIRARVEDARARQHERYGARWATNASVPARTLRSLGRFRPESFGPLRPQVDHGTLTGRGVDRVLRVARTVADLAGDAEVDAHHAVEALVLRPEVLAKEAAA